MTILDPKIVEELRSELTEDEARALEKVESSQYVGEISEVDSSDRLVKVVLFGRHPRQEVSNALWVPLSRFSTAEPSGYVWLDLSDERDPEVKSVECSDALTSLLDKYYQRKYQRRNRANDSGTPQELADRVDDF